MLSTEDYAEAGRRYKDKRTKFHERQRYHALILVTQGYKYDEISRILLLTAEAVGHLFSSLNTGAPPICRTHQALAD